jgi:hypothetical protein
MSETHDLCAPVAALAKRFDFAGGEPRLSREAMLESREARLASRAELGETLLVDLVALAIKLKRLGGDAAGVAVIQLFALAAEVLPDQARAAFAEGGVDVDSATLSAIGAQASKRPVGAAPAGKGSLFALLVDEKK